MDSNRLAELMFKEEALLPELRPYVRKGPLGQMLNHPLVQEIIYRPELNALINERYRHKQAAIDHAIKHDNWSSVLFLHERPYRISVLLDHGHVMSDKDYWRCVGQAWIDSENIWQNLQTWKELWSSNRPYRDMCMDEDDREVYASLPETMTVFRGVHDKGATKRTRKKGISWSLSREKAEWFANRYRSETTFVMEGTVARKDVLAYFNGRSEQEIVSMGVR